MNVIPFPRAPAPDPLEFSLGARVDLRLGALAAGVVRPRGPEGEAFAYSNLARVLRGARLAWRERGAQAALTLAVPAALHGQLDPDFLSEAAQEAGYTRRGFSFELCEREIVRGGAALAEDLRARGWAIALKGDPDCPLPFGAKARSLYAEIVLDAPEAPHPFLAMEDGDRSPLGRRLLAAKAAGIIVTAETVRTSAQAKTLALAGFDRGGGPFAEMGLR